MLSMPQSLSNVLVHLVFSTKGRSPLLTAEIRQDLFAYLAATLRNHGCPTLEVGGVADHVHLLFSLSRTLTIAQAAEKVKSGSSKMLKSKIPEFAWQGGYGAFSVSAKDRASVMAYIRNQEGHHQSTSFQEEFRSLLIEFGVAYDERYLWD